MILLIVNICSTRKDLYDRFISSIFFILKYLSFSNESSENKNNFLELNLLENEMKQKISKDIAKKT